MIQSLLIANRGESACRIIRTLRALTVGRLRFAASLEPTFLFLMRSRQGTLDKILPRTGMGRATAERSSLNAPVEEAPRFGVFRM
jgi:Biotin carboxylase, N-terminal domain